MTSIPTLQKTRVAAGELSCNCRGFRFLILHDTQPCTLALYSYQTRDHAFSSCKFLLSFHVTNCLYIGRAILRSIDFNRLLNSITLLLHTSLRWLLDNSFITAAIFVSFRFPQEVSALQFDATMLQFIWVWLGYKLLALQNEMFQIVYMPWLLWTLVGSSLCVLVWRLWTFTIRPYLRPQDPKELPYWIPCK